MKLNSILSPVQDDMRAVDQVIKDRLASDVVLINQLAGYLINSGGKRLRPAITLLSARAAGYQGEAHHLLAAIIELIHSATLLHDDVVDNSKRRRGQQTANAVWGNEASVLTGDFLYSRAFQMMVELDDMRVMQVLADTTNRIAAGEVMQLLNCNNPDVSEADYLDVIERKTASLFSAATQLGAGLGNEQAAAATAFKDYGLHLGRAFQLIDDALDYSAESAAALGKNLGDDLAEGKPTLPLIYAMKQSQGTAQDTLRAAIETGGRDAIEAVMATIESTGAMEYTAALAKKEAEGAAAALTDVPDSEFKSALVQLTDFAVSRSH